MYHVNEKGNVGPCRAQVRACPLDSPHCPTAEQTRAAYEARASWTPTVPAPRVKPTGWDRVLDRPEQYPTYLAQAVNDALRTDPDSLVNAWEWTDGGNADLNINLTAGHWVEARIGVIDREVTSWFMHGHCAALALELAPLKTGQVVVFETDRAQITGERWVHVAAVNEDGTCTDIEGVKQVQACADAYDSHPVTYDLNHSESRDRFLALTCQGKTKDEAFDGYYSKLEQAMIRHYAELAFHKYG